MRRATLVVPALVVVALAAALHHAPIFSPADARSRLYDGVVVERTGTAEAERFVVRLDDGRRVTATLPTGVTASARERTAAFSTPAARTWTGEESIRIGERLHLRARFVPPDEPRNPGEPSPGEFAVERGLSGSLVHAHLLAREHSQPNDLHLWLPLARAWAGDRLRERLEEPYATILIGMLWGERGALPPDLRAEFQDTGTVHVLVTAGLHLGVVAALALWSIGAFGGGRIGASLGAIAVVWLYAVFSGAHLPSLRAATMASFFLLARASGRSAFSWNALALAAIVVTLLRPAAATSLSFALSFSCVGAILLFAEPLTQVFERLRLPELAREALALTFATQIGTWPLTASAFLVFAPYAPFANALVVPAVGVAMLAGFAQLAATPIPLVAQLCASVESLLLTWIVGVVHFSANLPGAHVVMTPPPPWTIACYDVALLVVADLLLGEKALISKTLGLRMQSRLAVAGLLFAGACALCIWPPRSSSHDLRITAIDVGQADALLIQTPHGDAILVDAGGRLERGVLTAGASPAEAIGERIVVPFLIRHGIHHLAALIVSHPHGDHVGGAAPVLRTLGADLLADSGQAYPGHAYHDALDVAHTQRVPILQPRAGDLWKTDDGLTFRFYGPSEPFINGSRNDINNNSIVFMLEYRCPACGERFRMLFTGDAGAEAERRLLATGADLKADVLKVGHHGSAYGTTPAFVRAVAPRYAIISVGRDNLFGHPSSSTLKRLEAAGARIWRTDGDRALTIRVSGGDLKVDPFSANLFDRGER